MWQFENNLLFSKNDYFLSHNVFYKFCITFDNIGDIYRLWKSIK